MSHFCSELFEAVSIAFVCVFVKVLSNTILTLAVYVD